MIQYTYICKYANLILMMLMCVYITELKETSLYTRLTEYRVCCTSLSKTDAAIEFSISKTFEVK